jgi:hypothetical protein
VHGHVLRYVEQGFRIVEDDPDARLDQVVRNALRVVGGNRDDAHDDVLLPNRVREARVVADRNVPDRTADLVWIGVENGGDVDSVLREDRRAGNRLTEAPRSDQRDVVLALGAEDLADLSEQRILPIFFACVST